MSFLENLDTLLSLIKENQLILLLLIIVLFYLLLNHKIASRILIISIILIIGYRKYYNYTSKKSTITGSANKQIDKPWIKITKMADVKSLFREDIFRLNRKTINKINILLDKLEFWYNKSNCQNKSNNTKNNHYINNYFNNIEFYHKAIKNEINSIGNTLSYNTKKYNDFKEFSDNILYILDNKINRLKKLMINNKVNFNYLNNHTLHLTPSNDTQSPFYNKYYNVY